MKVDLTLDDQELIVKATALEEERRRLDLRFGSGCPDRNLILWIPNQEQGWLAPHYNVMQHLMERLTKPELSDEVLRRNL